MPKRRRDDADNQSDAGVSNSLLSPLLPAKDCRYGQRGSRMKLTTRIERLERLERLAGIGEPLKLTIAFFDGVLNGTISDEELSRYAPALHDIVPPTDLERA